MDFLAAPALAGTRVTLEPLALEHTELLQMTHAFETLGCIAVEFRTHWNDQRSRRAISALGAEQDGVLRNHDLWRDGTVRDVVVFSVIDRERPTGRLSLREKLRTAPPTSKPST